LAADWLIDGLINPKKAAATMMPEAKPKDMEYDLSLGFFLKKKTKADPRVVPAKMMKIDKIIQLQ
jgi:hypothetical protein